MIRRAEGAAAASTIMCFVVLSRVQVLQRGVLSRSPLLSLSMPPKTLPHDVRNHPNAMEVSGRGFWPFLHSRGESATVNAKQPACHIRRLAAMESGNTSGADSPALTICHKEVASSPVLAPRVRPPYTSASPSSTPPPTLSLRVIPKEPAQSIAPPGAAPALWGCGP